MLCEHHPPERLPYLVAGLNRHVSPPQHFRSIRVPLFVSTHLAGLTKFKPLTSRLTYA